MLEAFVLLLELLYLLLIHLDNSVIVQPDAFNLLLTLDLLLLAKIPQRFDNMAHSIVYLVSRIPQVVYNHIKVYPGILALQFELIKLLLIIVNGYYGLLVLPTLGGQLGVVVASRLVVLRVADRLVVVGQEVGGGALAREVH